MKLTEWLKENGFGFEVHPKDEALIVLTGEWISPYQDDVFEAAATIEPVGCDAYRIHDSGGDYRVELYHGSGANGVICDWGEYRAFGDRCELEKENKKWES